MGPVITAAAYSYSVAWSDEDRVFIARVVDFPDLATHGDTADQALAEARSLVSFMLTDMKARGERPPPPAGR
jgi:predicted RNase H-like HicB family nuclease